MPHVTTSDGRDLGEVTDPGLLAYYAGEGYQIGDPPATSLDLDAPADAPAPNARPVTAAPSQSAEIDSDGNTDEGEK